jgi:tetratricopeptide (TPR) repeat protein
MVARNSANESAGMQDSQASSASEAPSSDESPDSDLRTFLGKQSAARLAGWLADLADSDSAIEKRLRVYQAQSDPRALRAALGKLLRAPRFLDWRRSRAFARELDPVVDILSDIAASDPANGVALFEYTLMRMFKIYEQCDDSGGDIGERMQDIAGRFLKCLALQPSGVARAKSLLALQRVDGWDLLPVKKIWPLLDETGRTAYAAAIEAEFRALSPHTQENRAARWSAEFGAVHRMEALAEARGDVDKLIEVLARDLTSGYAYERIVAVCEKAGRAREAMQWAERGLRAHPDWRGMRALVARQYDRAGLADEALELLWQDFKRELSINAWRCLQRAAGHQWPKYRERALDHVTSRERMLPDGRRDVSLRVTLLLADGDAGAACQLGEQHVLSPHVLDLLARATAESHPQSAAGFLRRSVDAGLPRVTARDYAAIANQIAQVMALAPGSASRDWLNEIRTAYRARRKFMALLDAALVTLQPK